MRKSATLLALFLAASFILTAQAACDIQYQDYYDPEEICDFWIDDGFPRVNCATNGPGEPTGISRPASVNPTFSNLAFAVQNIWFFGDCDCTVRAYTNANLGGCYVESHSSSDNIGRVFGQDLWNKAGTPQSFSVTCQI